MSIYAKQLKLSGLHVFPCWVRKNSDEDRWDKGPAVPKNMSWKVAGQLPYENLEWKSQTVGVCIPENVVVIDLDPYKDGAPTPWAMEQELGCELDWDRALIQKTISGGYHYAFYAPYACKQLTTLTTCDIRAGGKGFICSGEGYSPCAMGAYALTQPELLPPIPTIMRSLIEEPAAQTRPIGPAVSAPEAQTVISALRRLDPGCNRADWVLIGCALAECFTDDNSLGLDLFHRWSAGEYWTDGQPPNYTPEHVEQQWPTFKAEGKTTRRTLFHKAIAAGWEPPRSFDVSAAFGDGAAALEVFQRLAIRIDESGSDITSIETLLQEIRHSQCNGVQIELLTASLMRALQEARLLTPELKRKIRAVEPKRSGAKPQGESVVPSEMPLHPDLWAPFQTSGKDMKPKGTIHNFQIMMKAYGIRIEYNEINKTIKLLGEAVPQNGVLHDDAALSFIDHLANLNNYPKPDARAMIPFMANENTVNPVRDWVYSRTYDGRDHVGHLFNQMVLSPKDDHYLIEVLWRKWFRGAYAIGVGAINKMEHVPVFVEENGGIGKTRFFETWAPEHLRKSSLILDLNNKDSIKLAVSYWLAELGELDGTFSRSDQARLKTFLSLEFDELRLPYGRAYLKYPRRTAFVASVNEENFLLDGSGNRRYWPLRVLEVNYRHNCDMQQVWAQAAYEFHTGQLHYLTDGESLKLKHHNEQFRTNSRISDLLGAAYPKRCDENGVLLSTTECLARAGVLNPTKGELNEGAKWLRRNGFIQRRGTSKRGFIVPEFIEPPMAAGFQPRVVK